MTWNYRVIKQKDSDGITTFGIHQVFYDNTDVINNCTDTPVQIISDEEDEEEGTGLKWQLEQMMEALKKPILNYEDIVDLEVEEKRKEIIKRMMKYSGFTEAEARFAAAIELGEIEGDTILVNNECELDNPNYKL